MTQREVKVLPLEYPDPTIQLDEDPEMEGNYNYFRNQPGSYEIYGGVAI